MEEICEAEDAENGSYSSHCGVLILYRKNLGGDADGKTEEIGVSANN
jgi:hypothetical protein